MSQITVYPRLYTTRSPVGSGVIASKGDATLDSLYKFYLDHSVNNSTWSYRRRVLESALRLFGDIREWMRDQRNNPRIVGYNLEFLKDTLDYIRTGKRQMSISTWIELVAEATDHAPIPTHLTAPPLALEPSDTTVQLLQRWCAQADGKGFEDLLYTLHVLFGPARSSLV